MPAQGRQLSADRQIVRQLHAITRVQGLEGLQLGRRHPHGQGRLALGRRFRAADSRHPRPDRRFDHVDLSQHGAAGAGRPAGRVEPRRDQGRWADDLGLGEWPTGAAGRHGPASRAEASQSRGLDRAARSWRQDRISQSAGASSARRRRPGRLACAAGADRPRTGGRSTAQSSGPVATRSNDFRRGRRVGRRSRGADVGRVERAGNRDAHLAVAADGPVGLLFRRPDVCGHRLPGRRAGCSVCRCCTNKKTRRSCACPMPRV